MSSKKCAVFTIITNTLLVSHILIHKKKFRLYSMVLSRQHRVHNLGCGSKMEISTMLPSLEQDSKKLVKYFLIQSIEISTMNKYLTMKSDQIIDFWEARKHPLSIIPLSLCFPDGTVRITNNSTITKLISQIQIFEVDAYASVGTYFLDLMATI